MDFVSNALLTSWSRSSSLLRNEVLVTVFKTTRPKSLHFPLYSLCLGSHIMFILPYMFMHHNCIFHLAFSYYSSVYFVFPFWGCVRYPPKLLLDHIMIFSEQYKVFGPP